MGAVRVSPDAEFAVAPVRFNPTSIECVGSRFVISNHNLLGRIEVAYKTTVDLKLAQIVVGSHVGSTAIMLEVLPYKKSLACVWKSAWVDLSVIKIERPLISTAATPLKVSGTSNRTTMYRFVARLLAGSHI